MLQQDQLSKQQRRIDGEAVCPQAKVPTYQDLLDAALDDTFPASDPLAIGAATHVHEPHTTARDCHDWTLRPGACKPVGQATDDGAGHERSARSPAHVTRDLLVQEQRIPAGPCWIEQSSQAATLRWRGEAAGLLALEVSLECLRQWLADGLLKRSEEI